MLNDMSKELQCYFCYDFKNRSEIAFLKDVFLFQWWIVCTECYKLNKYYFVRDEIKK